MRTLKIEGSTSNIAEVAVDNLLQIRPSPVTSANVASKAAGSLRIKTENDAGQLTGMVSVREPQVSVDYRLRTGLDTLLFFDNFNMTAQNTGIWKMVSSTMTLTAGGGFLLFNTGLSGTAAQGVSYSTWRYFSLIPSAPLIVEGSFEINVVPQANQVLEFGLFVPTTAGITAPVDGIYFRLTSDGLCGVLNYSGKEVTTGNIIQFEPLSNLVLQLRNFYIIVDVDQVHFHVDNTMAGMLDIPRAVGTALMTTGLPVTIQQRNAGTVSATPYLQVKCSQIVVSLGDAHTSKPWPHQMAGLGLNVAQLQNSTATPTITTCTNALYTNNLGAGAGIAMTNTTAALGAGLGGQFGALPTLTAGQDGVLSSFQNPVGSVNIAPRTMMITGVRVQGAVTTSLTNGPVLYAYALCYGGTGVSSAQAETGSFVTATTKAFRRIPLGFETYASGAVAGVLGGPGILVDFQTPVVVNPGEFVMVTAKNLGTVTASGVINVLVTLLGYFE
jgi:hypothetical protein